MMGQVLSFDEARRHLVMADVIDELRRRDNEAYCRFTAIEQVLDLLERKEIDLDMALVWIGSHARKGREALT